MAPFRASHIRTSTVLAAAAATAVTGALLVVTACGSSTSSGAEQTLTLADGATVAVTSGCAAHPTAGFCDDFENETDASLATNWPYSVPNAEFLQPVVATEANAFSGTHVLHADAPFVFDAGPNDPGHGQKFMIVSRALPTVLESQSVHVGFVMRIASFAGGDAGTPSPNIQIQVYPIDISRGGTTVQIKGDSSRTLTVSTSGYNGSPIADPSVTVPFTLGQWIQVDVVTSFAKGTSDAGTPTYGSTSVSLDGQMISTTPFANLIDMESKTYGGMLTLGSFGFSEEPDTVVELDDVYLEQK